jgi:hypothetical protein
MTLQDQAISLRLDRESRKRLEKAAALTHQTPEAFAKQATDERARDVLLDWAVRRYHQGDTTYSLLAEETGLGVAEIMYAMGDEGLEEALATFLARADALAEERGNPDLPRLARRVAAKAREESRRLRDWGEHS